MLELRNVKAGYGPVDVLNGVSLVVPTGSCVCLIGANGAGKSTTLGTICGLVSASSGNILLEGAEINGCAVDALVRRGISLVPEGRRVVSNMTVEDNLLVGAYTRKDTEIGSDLEAVFKRFPRLKERRNQYAGSLSGGEQQILAIGRALMARPKLLLLDEPSMGLAPQIVNDIFRTVREINDGGTTVLLVEQNARKALSVSDYGYVLESGRIHFEGKASEMRKSPQVVEAYLGGSAA
jgi:branched-chain amino acid transport system ATP-binding protein